MGITYIAGEVEGPDGKEPVRFLIDSGATYSLLPLEVWKKIGLTAKRTLEFTLADGTIIKRGVSECHLVLPQGEGHTPVILGEAEDEALLGVVTLEILGLLFNPFNRTFQPMKMYRIASTLKSRIEESFDSFKKGIELLERSRSAFKSKMINDS